MPEGIPIYTMLSEERLRIEKVEHPNEAPSFTEAQATKIHDEFCPGWEIEDWKNPDYPECEADRAITLDRIRERPEIITALKLHYKINPWDFIADWGYTFDPRNPEVGIPAKIPFIPFPKQKEWLQYVVRKWRAREPGLTEKSRECGVSWLAISLGCTLCLHYTGLNIGYGSRIAGYVDAKETPKALFYRGRKFMEFLPPEFNGGWREDRDSALFRMLFRETQSTIVGETGDNLGRGDRASIYFVDEAAHLEHPFKVDTSLSQTTNCQQDISSVNGTANSFYVKRFSGRVEPFIFDWRDDPRKDEAWYQREKARLDPVIVAQEIDRDYGASTEGIMIPSAWVQAAIDAHIKMGWAMTGRKFGTLDVADTGKDKNAFIGGTGNLIEYAEMWSGKNSDIYASAERAVQICEDRGYPLFRYDADGLGTGMRGDIRKINEQRALRNAVPILGVAYRGSEAVWLPEAMDEPPVLNKNNFFNRKAQGWQYTRRLFLNTHRAVIEGLPMKPDECISISSKISHLSLLTTELSQPTGSRPRAGKLVIDKQPPGTVSPNLADALVIRFAPMPMPLNITPVALSKSQQPGPGARRRRR